MGDNDEDRQWNRALGSRKGGKWARKLAGRILSCGVVMSSGRTSTEDMGV
jgi:hypothetical protein